MASAMRSKFSTSQALIGKSILSVGQFSRADLDNILDCAAQMRAAVARFGMVDLLKGKLACNLFFEPSTRTSASFAAAIQRLGGTLLQINNVQFSSITKGETFEDTIRTLDSYCDAIVLRHPDEGMARLAAEVSNSPIINAGDGKGEHPTQALLDLYTIQQEFGHIDGLTITMLGDLKYGRTVHSLAQLLTCYDVKLNYVSPKALTMPEKITKHIAKSGLSQSIHHELKTVLPESDIIYVTRIQRERFDNLQEYEALKGSYIINKEVMCKAKKTMRLLHPLPRVDEIDQDVDKDPRAAYFRQMENGMYTRMALMALVLGS